jgi:hypothetical protein
VCQLVLSQRGDDSWRDSLELARGALGQSRGGDGLELQGEGEGGGVGEKQHQRAKAVRGRDIGAKAAAYIYYIHHTEVISHKSCMTQKLYGIQVIHRSCVTGSDLHDKELNDGSHSSNMLRLL